MPVCGILDFSINTVVLMCTHVCNPIVQQPTFIITMLPFFGWEYLLIDFDVPYIEYFPSLRIPYSVDAVWETSEKNSPPSLTISLLPFGYKAPHLTSEAARIADKRNLSSKQLSRDLSLISSNSSDFADPLASANCFTPNFIRKSKMKPH